MCVSHPAKGGTFYFCTMKDETPHLLTAAEFNAQVRRWADEVKAMAAATLATGTHGTGQLRERFAAFVDTTRHIGDSQQAQEAAAYKVKFGFDRYGVFRAYGVGRGWVRVNGVLVRGFRARSESEIRNKTWNVFTTELSRQGMSSREINTFKFLSQEKGTGKVRTPLDWLDQHINRRINELADYVQEYYGDVAMKQLLEEIGKVRIVKKGNNVSIQ